MTSSSLRRRVAVLLVGSFLLVPWSSTAEPLLTRFWSTLTAIWGDAGCTIDPFGCPGGTGSPDNGCSLDPYGLCTTGASEAVPAITPDEGCSADPFGRCRSGS